MKYLIILFLLIYTNCFAITAKEASKITHEANKKDLARQEKRDFTYCKNGISYSIEKAAQKGENYVHLLLPVTCWGNNIEKVQNYLRSVGFKVSSVESGINSIHWETVLTISW